MRPSDHGLRDPNDCESREDIEICILKDDVISLCIGKESVKISLENFLTEIEQRCQDSLHNIFDEAKAKSNDEFERLAAIFRPNYLKVRDRNDAELKNWVEDNSRSDADSGL